MTPSAEHRLISLNAVFTPTHTLNLCHLFKGPTHPWCTHTGYFHLFWLISPLHRTMCVCLQTVLDQNSPSFSCFFYYFTFTPLCPTVEAIISHDSLACDFASNQRIVILTLVLLNVEKCTRRTKWHHVSLNQFL